MGELDLDADQALFDLFEGGAVAVHTGEELLREGSLAFLVVSQQVFENFVALTQQGEEGANEGECEDKGKSERAVLNPGGVENRGHGKPPGELIMDN